MPIILDIPWMLKLFTTLYNEKSDGLFNNGRLLYLGAEVPLFTEKYINQLLNHVATDEQVIHRSTSKKYFSTPFTLCIFIRRSFEADHRWD